VIVLVAALFALIGYYVVRNEPKIADSPRKIAELCGLIVASLAIARLLATQPWDAELIPVALVAMILAIASLLGYMKGEPARRSSRAVYEATLETVSDGVRTADLGGQASTSDFTTEVIRRIKTKVEVWSALADIER
jgi:hypothetical protein